jgi:polar amino acid transport system substrate-binding protein
VSSPLLAEVTAQTDKTLRLAVIYIEEPPFIYTSPTSEYMGIVPSLAKALARELNLQLEFLPIPRKGIERSLINDDADIAWLSPVWVKNKKQLIFSDSVFLHREFLYSLEPIDESKNPAYWLKNKTICLREDYQYPSLNRFFANKIAKPVKVSSQVPLIQLLLKKRCDVLYMNEHRASWMVDSLGVEQQVWRSSKPLDEAALGFMFHKKWQVKMAQVNNALADIKRSGELNTIIQTNIHPTLKTIVKTD